MTLVATMVALVPSFLLRSAQFSPDVPTNGIATVRLTLDCQQRKRHVSVNTNDSLCLFHERSFASKAFSIKSVRKRANMWRAGGVAPRLELRGKTLCFIVLLVLSSQVGLYYIVRMLLSER